METAGAILDRLITFIVDHWWLLLVLAAAFLFPKRPPKWPALRISDWAACLAVTLVAFLVPAVATWMHGDPLPHSHDEYGNLLGAAMYARGYVAWPAHPLWPHFEALHVLVTPSYASIYPPGQGTLLAMGMRLFGRPAVGLWFGVAGACAAIWWALRVWTTSAIALLGGLAAALNPAMLEWATTYQGGPVAAAGGGLVLAAAGRLLRRTSHLDSAVMGLGLVLLAFSRPFEGLMLALGVAIAMARNWRPLLRVAPACIIVVLCGTAALGAYDRAITGNPLLMPHVVYDRQYLPAGNFLWDPIRPMHYRHAEQQQVLGVLFVRQRRHFETMRGLLDDWDRKLRVSGYAVFGAPTTGFAESLWPLFYVLLWSVPAVVREKWRLVVVAAVFTMAPLVNAGWLLVHYLAPVAATGAVILMLLLARLGRGSIRGAFLATCVYLLLIGNSISMWNRWAHAPNTGFERQRIDIAQSLEARGGRHLIIVAQDVFSAVYNAPDIDRSPVVWAHDLGPDADRRLRAYFRDRQVWRLVREGGGVRLLMD